MMSQSPLSFQYQSDNSADYTAFAGLPLFLDLTRITGLYDAVAEALNIKQRGWTDQQMIMSLILLNLSGGDCVDDIDRLESDTGLRNLMIRLETQGMSRKARREYERRFRKSKQRAFPSASVIHRYLENFHNIEEESKRVEGHAFIPAANSELAAFQKIHRVLIDFMQQHNPIEIATLDQDATLSHTHKSSALFCYKKFKAYQPFNTYWHEQQLLLHTEFRDGNVNAGLDQLRVFEESLLQLPEGVKTVYLRSDSAGYQQELLEYCAEGSNERFGVIEFAIAARVSAAFKLAVMELDNSAWQPIEKTLPDGNTIKTDQEWAEVCFVPTWAAKKKDGPSYRYIAIREKLATQLTLEGIEPVQTTLPFQTLAMNEKDYKLFAVVTNRTLPGNELIQWHRERCGDSEKVHSIEKSDLAGGQFPSKKFGANACWWQIMALSFNAMVLMKKLILPESLSKKRMKGLRFHVINIAGRVVFHARQLFVKVSEHDAIELLQSIKQRLSILAIPPPEISPTGG